MNFSKYTVLLKSAIGVIIFLFGAFSGFLMKFAPPDPSDTLKLPVGIVQFIALALLLFISVLCHYQTSIGKLQETNFTRIWLFISGGLLLLFIFSAIVYYSNYKKYVIRQDNWNISLVRGETLTDDSKQICIEEKHDGSPNDCETFLLYKYYNSNEIFDKHLLWTEDSMHKVNMKLLINYIIVIASISSLLFSLVELMSFSIFEKEKIIPGSGP